MSSPSLATAVLFFVAASCAHAGLIVSTSGKCDAGTISASHVQNGVFAAASGQCIIGPGIGSTVYWRALCPSAQSTNMTLTAHAKADCSDTPSQTLPITADGKTCSNLIFLSLESAQRAFVGSCQGDTVWPAIVSNTAGIFTISATATSSTCTAANFTGRTLLYQASGGVLSCPSKQFDITCNADGSLTYRDCGGNTVLPPTPTGCAVGSLSTSPKTPQPRAYRNTCPVAGVTEPPTPGGGAIGALVALAVVVTAVNVWYWRSKAAEAKAGHSYSTMEDQHEEL